MKIPFATARDGRIVEARQLAEGAAGPFFCPCCRTPVVLKQGAIRVWHFAHRADASCTTAFETALHQLAKQILVEASHLQTPALVYQVRPGGVSIQLRPAQTVRWSESGEVEKWLGDFRPDFVLSQRGLRWTDAVAPHPQHDAFQPSSSPPADTSLIVEVAVTHFCDDDKRKKLRALGIPAVEVNLSGVSRDITEEALRQLLLDDVACKRWIYHEGEAEALVRIRALQDEEDARNRRVYEEAEARRVAFESALREREKRNAKTLQERRWSRGKEIEQANRVYRQSTLQDKLAFVASKLGVEGAWPAELNVQVRGGESIGVPPRIWQGDLFRRHILGKSSKGGTAVSVEAAAEWLTLRYALEPSTATSVRVAIWDFFKALEAQGYLVRAFQQTFNIRRDTLKVPAEQGPRHDERLPALFWARSVGTNEQFIEAAAESGIRASPSQLRALRDNAITVGFGLSEEDYVRSVAVTLKVSPAEAAEFLVAAGVFVRLGGNR